MSLFKALTQRPISYALDLAPGDDLFAALRQMVERGDEDAPVRVLRAGRHSLTVSSLHGGALLAVAEEPRARIVPWTPHPNAAVGPRVAALLAKRAAEKAARHARDDGARGG